MDGNALHVEGYFHQVLLNVFIVISRLVTQAAAQNVIVTNRYQVIVRYMALRV